MSYMRWILLDLRAGWRPWAAGWSPARLSYEFRASYKAYKGA